MKLIRLNEFIIQKIIYKTYSQDERPKVLLVIDTIFMRPFLLNGGALGTYVLGRQKRGGTGLRILLV